MPKTHSDSMYRHDRMDNMHRRDCMVVGVISTYMKSLNFPSTQQL